MEAATTVREGVISLPETLNDPAANVAASTRLRNNLVPFLRRETASSLLPVGKLQLSALMRMRCSRRETVWAVFGILGIGSVSNRVSQFDPHSSAPPTSAPGPRRAKITTS